MFVIPSVKRTNSIWLPGPSQSGFRDRTSLRAEACESAWLYDRGMYLREDMVVMPSPGAAIYAVCCILLEDVEELSR